MFKLWHSLGYEGKLAILLGYAILANVFQYVIYTRDLIPKTKTFLQNFLQDFKLFMKTF